MRGLGAFAPEALAEYERCAAHPGTAEAICEDYRASAGIDLVHDRADIDAGRRLAAAARAVGRARRGGRCFDVLALWRERAAEVSGRSAAVRPLHPEEAPDELLAEALFFSSPETNTFQGATHEQNRIAVIAGDGIGKETMPEGMRVLDAAAASSAST
jgi:haloacetate dehalogenase